MKMRCLERLLQSGSSQDGRPLMPVWKAQHRSNGPISFNQPQLETTPSGLQAHNYRTDNKKQNIANQKLRNMLAVRSRARTMLSSSRILSVLFFSASSSSLSQTNSSHHQSLLSSSSSSSSPSLLLSSPVSPHLSLPNTFCFPSPFLSSRRGFSSSPMDALGDEIEVSYIGQQAAKEIDEILMGPLGFSVDQLMVGFSFVFFLFSYLIL
jgi:hypothetical protein